MGTYMIIVSLSSIGNFVILIQIWEDSQNAGILRILLIQARLVTSIVRNVACRRWGRVQVAST